MIKQSLSILLAVHFDYERISFPPGPFRPHQHDQTTKVTSFRIFTKFSFCFVIINHIFLLYQVPSTLPIISIIEQSVSKRGILVFQPQSKSKS